MSTIAIGIMCFGEDYYFKQIESKLDKLKNGEIRCYVLTDKPNYFFGFTGYSKITIIPYSRHLKSYHDKMILVKEILKYHDTAILLDADTSITDYSFIDELVKYPYQKGITYVETLLGHKIKKEYVKDIQMNPNDIDWLNYKTYLQKIYPQYGDLETIYEYFLVFNKEGLKDNFYQMYEKLQVIKESCDVISGKKTVVGSGEGISIQVSARICGIQIQRDNELRTLIKDKIDNINRI
jgi:hypothetical protein